MTIALPIETERLIVRSFDPDADSLAADLTQLEVPTIIALTDEENERSARVAQRIGMTRLGTIDAHGRPHLLFSATR